MSGPGKGRPSQLPDWLTDSNDSAGAHEQPSQPQQFTPMEATNANEVVTVKSEKSMPMKPKFAPKMPVKKEKEASTANDAKPR